VQGINLKVKFKEFKISIKNFRNRISNGVKIIIAIIAFVASVITIISSQQLRLFFKRLAFVFWSWMTIKTSFGITILIIIGFILIYTVIKRNPKKKHPDWWNYRKDFFYIDSNNSENEWFFVWEYAQKSLAKPEPINIKAVCENCRCELVYEKPEFGTILSGEEYVCPACTLVYFTGDNNSPSEIEDRVEKLIKWKIDSEKYKNSKLYQREKAEKGKETKVQKKHTDLIKGRDQDKILRAYTRLKGIKDNLPENTIIPTNHINDYHNIIDSLEGETALSLSEYRIPDTEVNEYRMGTLKGCEKSFFMSKLDALLSYFEFKYLSEKKIEIGFKPPNKEKEQ